MKNNTKKLVFASLMAAIACILTTLAFPLPFGYANLGDGAVLLGTYILGPLWGAVAGGIGTMLADVILGYAVYAPATLIIKGLVAVIAGSVYIKLGKKYAVVSGILGEIAMVLGYFIYESLVLGYGMGASASILGNCGQAVIGIAVSSLLIPVIKKIKI